MPSKLSIHLSAYPNRVYDILARMQPSIVKVFNQSSEMNIDAIRAHCPSTIIVYRQYTNLDYHGSADAFFNEIADTFNKLRGRGILWEGINEPTVNSIADAQALNAWYVRFAELMHAQGELVAGFSWSTGNPTPQMLPQIIPHIQNAAAAVDVHAFHEYYTTWGGQGMWHQYRAFERALPAASRKPVIITEAGLDDNGDPQTGGYRGKLSNQQYLDVLKQYDAGLLEDPYVLGAVVYQWGDGGWPSFELSPMIDLFANHVASVGGGVVTPKPWPVPVFGAPPPAFSFSANPSTIVAGQASTLKWDVDGARTVSLDGQAVNAHDTRVVAPAQTTTYTLRVVFLDNSARDLIATITVNPVTPGPTFSFSATPNTITPGQAVTLKWDVEGVREVYLDGQGVTGHETRVVTPMQTTTYTLHIVFRDGSTKDLTQTVTVATTPPPPPPTFSFTATPPAIASGASATLQWNVTSAKSVSLDGQSVAASGARVVTPTQTTTYTLRIVFLDNSTKELSATVTVAAAPPPGATRPPTVVLTAENVAHLKTFARPPDDNGRGIHFGLDLRQPILDHYAPRLAELGIKWVMVAAGDELQMARAAKTIRDVARAFPLARPLCKIDGRPPDWERFVKALTDLGLPPYVQIFNEPGDPREWNRRPSDAEYPGIFARKWSLAAQTVVAAGGLPGVQILGKEEWDALVAEIGASDPIWKRAWFSLHNYGANHPPAYPYDPRNQQDHPGATIFTDDVTVINFLAFAKWQQDSIGFVLPFLGGEGGWEYGAGEDNRYPRVEGARHAQFHKEMFEWFRVNVIGNGEPLPDYLFSVAPWILYGWGADDWYDGVLGTKTETIDAVKSIPAFVRKFSWDGSAPPPPATFSFTVTPDTIARGASATLQWSVTGAQSVSLDGQTVAASGTRVVTPTQTTTYALRIVLLDGATKDLRATLTVTETPPPPALEWDARLDGLGVKLKPLGADAAQGWRLIKAVYQDETESGGNHHIYFKALRADGTPAAGVKFVVDWVGREAGDQPAIVTTDANGETNCALWAILHPELQDGPYFTFVKDAPSDTVSGMGLPVNRHVNFLLTFKYG